MKKIYLIVIGGLLTMSLYAQNYIPLRIDSAHTYIDSPGFCGNGNTEVQESFTGYSYDDDGKLVQVRRLPNRFTYSYSSNEEVRIAERQDDNGNWNMTYRSTKSFDGDRLVTKLGESYVDGDWINTAFYSYLYNTAGYQTTELLQHWLGGGWVDFYKEQRDYDDVGNVIEMGKYYAGNGVLQYNSGKLFQYDEANRKTQEINVISTSTGNHFAGKTAWFYGENDFLDSLVRYDYDEGFGIWEKTSKIAGLPFAEDVVVKLFQHWRYGEWKTTAETWEYYSEGVYGNQPDSVLLYSYDAVTATYQDKTKRYLSYEELEDGSIYFKDEEYTYLNLEDEWRLTKLIEEWYNIDQLKVGIDDEPGIDSDVVIYPNPCVAGQPMTIEIDLPNIDGIEAFVFDVQGRLVVHQNLTKNTVIVAPNEPGIYSVLLRGGEGTIGVTKVVVGK